MASVEDMPLDEIRRHFLDPQVVMRLVRELQARLEAMRKNPPEKINELGAQARGLEREIANLTNFVIKGDSSDAIRAALQEREAELKDVRRDLDALKRRQIENSPEVSEKWVTEELSSVRDLFNRKADKVPLIRAELRHLIADQILMTPTGEGKGKHYVATVRGRPLAILGDLPGVTQAQNSYSATGIRTVTDTYVDLGIALLRAA